MSLEVAVLIGSLRDRSYNNRLALALQKLGPADWSYVEVPIDKVPYYDEDEQQPLPASVKQLKEAIAGSDALIIVTPEYNRSVPGVLKNAIDWASRPKAENAFMGKPTLVAGTSPGSIGTAVAQAHLRNMLAYLDAPAMGQPEVYISFDPDDLIDMEGNVSVKDTEEFLRKVMGSFEEWVLQVRSGAKAVEKESAGR